MKISDTLNVSAEAYFNVLQRYLLKDLKKTVSKSINVKDLKQGYRFEKTYRTKDGDYVSKQEIVEMVYAKAYQLKFSVPGGYQIISHHIEELDNNHIKVVYEEIIESSKLSIKLRQFMRRGKSRKMMKQILHNLELEIQTKA
ncbi:MAG: DUF3284 domain-containing protein [Bacilli bacterium]|nr:DUF3284 domain-containing protein [Bacilli bacterium]